MKKLIITFLLVSMFHLQDSRVNYNEVEINKLNELAEETGLQLQEWQDVYIEEVSLKSFNHMKPLLLRNYTVKKVKNDQLTKYIFTPKTTAIIKHEIHAIILKQKKLSAKIKIIMTGDKWNEEINENYVNMTELLKDKYKLKLKSNFACAKLNDSGIINSGILINDIVGKLHAIHTDEQQDNLVDSIYEKNIYGESPFFEQEINVNNQKFNFQVVIRQTKNKKRQVILGTPIILNEY